MADGNINVLYTSLDYFALQIFTKGTNLGGTIAADKKDTESTITANGNAHARLTDENNLRNSLTCMSIRENGNIKVMGTAFKTSEEDLAAFYEQTFSYEIG